MIAAASAAIGWHAATRTGTSSGRHETHASASARSLIKRWLAHAAPTSAATPAPSAAAIAELWKLTRCCRIEPGTLGVRSIGQHAFEVSGEALHPNYLALLSRTQELKGISVLVVLRGAGKILVVISRRGRSLKAWVDPRLVDAD